MAEKGQTTKIAVIVALAIMLMIVVVIQTGVLSIGSRSGASGTSSQAGKTGSSAATGQGSTDQQVQWTRPEPIGPVVSDPTHMASSAATASPVETTETPDVEPEFRVAGIIFSTEQPSSIIIDGRILHEGDTIHGATVFKITETYAELHRGDKKWQIRAGQSNKEPE